MLVARLVLLEKLRFGELGAFAVSTACVVLSKLNVRSQLLVLECSKKCVSRCGLLAGCKMLTSPGAPGLIRLEEVLEVYEEKFHAFTVEVRGSITFWLLMMLMVTWSCAAEQGLFRAYAQIGDPHPAGPVGC